MIALALPLLPVSGAALLLALHARPRLLGPVAVSVLLLTLGLGLWAAAEEPAFDWEWSPAIRAELSVEGFSRVMAVLVPLIATPIVAYAAATEKEGRLRLLAFMLAFVGAMLLLVSAADFLTLLIAWELVGACSWALIGHGWRDPETAESARQAFITTRFGDLGLYFAAGLLFAERGSFTFTGLAGLDRPLLDAIAAGILLAAVAKSAQLPFSPWLFAAMAGPTPVSALLHSATLVAAGAYLLIRLSPMLEDAAWFLPAVAGVGLTTALAGGVVATVQTHAKRVLAGSTSAQYGLMFIAIGASSTAAAGAHLVTHAAFKSLLFLGAGVAIHATNSSELRSMRLGRVLPLIAALSLVGVLALAAVPPIGGAWTKEQIVAAAADSSIWLGAATLAAGFLSAVYASRFWLLVWSSDRGGGEDSLDGERPLAHTPGRTETASMAALTAATLLLSALWLPGAKGLVEDASRGELFEGGAWEFFAAIALVVAAAALAWMMLRRGLLLSLGLPGRLQASAGDWLGLPTAARLLVVDPVLALSGFLARFDNRVVDAGVRLAAAVAAAFSRLFSLRGEWTIDGVVMIIERMTMFGAQGSRLADEAGIDGAVEGGARGTGALGELSRKLQTGLAHHYYVLLAIGLAAIVGLLAVSL